MYDNLKKDSLKSSPLLSTYPHRTTVLLCMKELWSTLGHLGRVLYAPSGLVLVPTVCLDRGHCGVSWEPIRL